ncbi:hypothetical protein GGF46_001062 [Coemansia sp. RSA 552]|nr:hypothetical protein GGF46_001062 [Coemansia sp. RSA 552]
MQSEAAVAVAAGGTDDFIGLDVSSDEGGEDVVVASKKRGLDDDDDEEQGAGSYGKCYNGSAVPPWLQGARRLGSGKWPDINDMVNEEVAKFVTYISPTPEEHQMRAWVIERLQRCVDSMRVPGVRVVVHSFGSFGTQLYLPTSDIDMTVMIYEERGSGLSSRYDHKDGMVRFLLSLARHLKTSGFCRTCQTITRARVPIIKTNEAISGIAVDISVNADSGMHSAEAQRSFSEDKYPVALRSLVLVIKQFLFQRSMNEVYTGGMGSYATTLLVVSMLQMHPRLQSGGLDPAKNLGVLLIEFFELYGKRFNYDNVCVSVAGRGKYINKKTKGFHNHNQPYLLAIEDPCDATNDVTKGTYGINSIKHNFSGAYDLLNNAIFAYHQTRKFGEPINDALKAMAGGGGSEEGKQQQQPSKKRARGKAGRIEKSSGDSVFSDDPWAPVSFLSSILRVSPDTISKRRAMVDTFHKGTMQRVLDVQYQPQLVQALPPSASSGTLTSAAAAPVTPVVPVVDSTANEQIAAMKFDFASQARASRPKDPVVISDDSSEESGECGREPPAGARDGLGSRRRVRHRRRDSSDSEDYGSDEY